jgi:hypothetical protein
MMPPFSDEIMCQSLQHYQQLGGTLVVVCPISIYFFDEIGLALF